MFAGVSAGDVPRASAVRHSPQSYMYSFNVLCYPTAAVTPAAAAPVAPKPVPVPAPNSPPPVVPVEPKLKLEPVEEAPAVAPKRLAPAGCAAEKEILLVSLLMK